MQTLLWIVGGLVAVGVIFLLTRTPKQSTPAQSSKVSEAEVKAAALDWLKNREGDPVHQKIASAMGATGVTTSLTGHLVFTFHIHVNDASRISEWAVAEHRRGNQPPRPPQSPPNFGGKPRFNPN